MTDKKIDPTTPIKVHPDYPLWHEGCDRLLEAWTELFYEKDPKDDPATLAQFTDGCRSALFSTPEGRNFVDGWVGQFMDEPAFITMSKPELKYLVKDPKEPYLSLIHI